MSPLLLEDLLQSTAKKMLADFEASGQAKHPGSKGTVREDKVREFLDAHLSRTVDVVGSGEAVAADGQRSTQCDVMITDPTAPFLFDEESYRIATIEGVFGVIEVKSTLTSDELRNAMRKIARIKAMPRTAYMPTIGPQRWRRMYGREWHNMPMIGMVFAYDGAELDTLGQVLAEVAAELTDHPEQRTDSVWVLNRGALGFGLTERPRKSTLRRIPATRSGRSARVRARF